MNNISKNSQSSLQFMEFAVLQGGFSANLEALYTLSCGDFCCLQRVVCNFKISASLKALCNKGYSVFSSLHADAIYYIYRASLNLPPINNDKDGDIQLQTNPPCKYIISEKDDSQASQSSKTILVLDLGTTTGWAMIDSTGVISSGSVSFKPNRFEGGGMVYLRFKRWLTDIKHSSQQIDAVYFEEVRRHLGTDAAHKYGGFMAHLTAWCEHHGIPYQGIPVQTIKKHITGKGNASKADIMAAVKAKGFNPSDDNEADALSLLDYVVQMEGGN